MKFLKKRYIALLTLLSSVSLVGSGFSSWLVVNHISDFANLSINIESVTELQLFKNFSLSNTTITQDGFLKDEIFSNEGEIIINFSIDNQVASKGGYITSNSFKMTAAFSCSDSTFLGYISKPIIDISGATVGDNNTSSDQIANEITIPMTSTTGTTAVKLTYAVKGDVGSYYSNIPTMSFSVEGVKK